MSTLDWNILGGDLGLLLLKGFYYTIALTVCAGILAVFIGLVTGALSWLRAPFVAPVIRAYVSFTRNTPFVVQLFFVYFSIPALLPVEAIRFLQDIGFEFIVATVALGIYHGAFFCEVFRAALRGVPDGQLSGARALGLSVPFCLSRILMPQAVRASLPALISEAISLAKNTSIAIAIGVAELMYQYQYISNFYFRGVEALTAATILYVVLSLTISRVGVLLERRLGYRVAQTNKE